MTKPMAQETRQNRSCRVFVNYLILTVVVLASATVAFGQTQTITDGTNYGLHFVPSGNAIQINMEDTRQRIGDPPTEFTIVVNWYGVAADGSVQPQRLRHEVQRFSVRPGEAASCRFLERSRAGEYAGITVLLNFSIDPPDPDIDPPDPDVPQLSPSATVFLVSNEKGLIGMLLPSVEKIRKASSLTQ